jgi:hypothetical protein
MDTESGGLAWLFLRDDGRTFYGDRIVVRVGQTLTVEGPLVLGPCSLLWSRRAIDALLCAHGSTVCRVRPGGAVLEADKGDCGCSTELTGVAMAYADWLLQEFACWCAERALMGERAAGREPEMRSWEAIEVKRRWLHADCDDTTLAAARAAASDRAGAAREAAGKASWVGPPRS